MPTWVRGIEGAVNLDHVQAFRVREVNKGQLPRTWQVIAEMVSGEWFSMSEPFGEQKAWKVFGHLMGRVMDASNQMGLIVPKQNFQEDFDAPTE